MHPSSAPAVNAATLAAIVGELRARTGVDFSGYRTATVERRILNRMISVGTATYESYLELLRASAAEALELLSRVSIKVSRFYRNPASFDFLGRHVLPRLALARRPVKVWSAGCGCGEEAYTLAALLEHAGIPGTVHATDIDPAALEAAERGVYAAEAAADVPAELAASLLVPVVHGRQRLVAVGRVLRERVRFSRLDVLRGAPACAPFDLVSCRNLLIYLQPDVREQVFATLRGSLAPDGFLFLGEAEWPPEDVARSLQTLSHGARIFRARAESAEAST